MFGERRTDEVFLCGTTLRSRKTARHKVRYICFSFSNIRMLHFDLCRMPIHECRGNFGQLHGLCIYRQCGRCSRRVQVRLMQPCASTFLCNTFGHDGGDIWEVQRPLAQMLGRLVVHDSEQFPWSGVALILRARALQKKTLSIMTTNCTCSEAKPLPKLPAA